MKKLGLDFGTTNCTLSYFDSASGVLECYRMRNAGSSPYIPSFIRYDNEDDSIEIGRGAKKSQNDDDYRVFSGFKMLISETNKERLEAYGYVSSTPFECGKAYIQSLLHNYCEEQNISDGIEILIITVPEIWIKEHLHANRERLKELCTDLKLPSYRFLSEPVAASAYFAYCFEQKQGKPFYGHVLVCDYGGGTLDLSLSKVDGETITVLECTGKGHDEISLGKAGVAFDEAVIKRVYERDKQQKLSRNDPQFVKLMDSFEEHKIDLKSDVDKVLAQYLKNKSVNKKAFKIDEMIFKASDFVEAFDRVIKPDFVKALEEMKGYFKTHHVNDTDKSCFRVVMAGGFSSFYLVQQTVKDFFSSMTLKDERFNSCFTVEDTALAISKGAALVANKLISIEPTCPISVGLKIKTDVGGFLEDRDESILKKGIKISQYKDPVFINGRVEVDPALIKEPLVIFLGDGNHRRYVRLDKNIEQLFPNTDKENNQWEVGFSTDENFLYTLHAKDLQGEKQESPLGDLLEKISGPILVREEK